MTAELGAVGAVTEGVDMHATQGIGVVATDIPCDGRNARRVLGEVDDAADYIAAEGGS